MSPLFKFICALLLSSAAACSLTNIDERDEFTFPDAEQGDVMDADGVWRGNREWTGKLGARFKYAPGNCKGLVKGYQWNDDHLYGTDIPVPGSGHWEFTVAGPCKAPIKIKVIPAGEDP